ncbi:MAG: hypothetical protein E7229_05730 [Clostridiales bacterium]|nr:hypothetical protein [Clostridiales bacterium]MBR3261383.1 hypothetical protein [Bacillota bacterium]MBR3374780.1 hypothetical protein [Bacillota bacterium]MBR6956109.1 hypothetical protein [Bacillota bacterium]
MFKVLDGGLLETSAKSRKKFIKAFITNTRLMGVVGITIHWKLIDNSVNTEFWQCFYLDAEEYGFDSYESVVGPEDEDTEKLALSLSDRLMGGLGGVPVEISEREARSLVQDYVYMNVKKEIGIPDEAEVDFIMKPEITLSVQERKDLMDKQCEEITGDYQLVNYFVMRCVGQDFEAARYLSAGHMNFAALSGYMPSTLLRNSVELTGSDFNAGKKDNFRTAWTYRCQSLIEDRGSYFVMTSRVTVEDLKVIDFKVVDRERISPREADMMTKRDEYVILNELDIDPADFTKASCSYTVRSQETAYDTGRLFVIFNSDNSHVSNKIYKLHDDVFGSVFVNDLGQLIVSSFSRENADAIEKAILTEMRDDEVFLAARYSFDMPVLYEYVRSGFDDFEDFVDAISFDSSDD